jgi:hypothetical protein
MKSGTSYLQKLLSANKEALAGQGVLFPGRSWKQQVLGVGEVLERSRQGAGRRDGAWQALLDELAGWDGTGLISMEFLGGAGPAKVARVVESFEPGTVDVVVTARDLNRNIPAMWQETLKNGKAWSFDEFVAGVAAGDGPGPGKLFWREQGIARMCRRWADAVGTEKVTLVTVPHPGAAPDELWRRFASVIDVDPATAELPRPANESLGAASAEVMRLLNAELADLSFEDYAPVVKHALAKRVLGARRQDEPAVGFEVPGWVQERSAGMVERLRAMGIGVVGDLSELDPVAVPGVHPATLTPEQQLAAAIDALAGVVRSRVGDRRKG